MLRKIVVAALLTALPAAASAASRNFTDHEGNTIKGEVNGIKEGQVVLKIVGGTRKQFPLAAFSLDDRDFIVESLKDPRQIKELMAYALKNTVAKKEKSSGFGFDGSDRPTSRPVIPDGVFRPTLPPAGSGATTTGSQPSSNVELDLKAMYGLTFPTEELLAPASPRTWTDLGGDSLLATFDKVVQPGLVYLSASQGRTQTVPLVNLSRDDIEQIKKTLEADLSIIVFPLDRSAGGPAEIGSRLWTDRRGTQLTGKYKGQAGRDVIIEVIGKDEMYPLRGLSKEDRLWVEQEDKRRESRGQPGSAAGSSKTASTVITPPIIRSGTPPQTGFGGGQTAAASTAANPNAGSAASPAANNGSIPANTYFFRCPKCGHEWSRVGVENDPCPNCTPVAAGVDGKEIALKAFGGLLGLAGLIWGINKVRS